jgi:putative membrane protein
MIKFTDDDRQRITAAIQAAEQKTSGEFVAVVARASDHYLSIPLLWAAMAALLIPGVLLLLPAHFRYVHIYELQLVVFILLAGLFEFMPRLHLTLVPASIKRARAARMARAQFYQQGVHLTREHSGVLFFVSLAERHVEIVADKGIHEKLGEQHWREIVDTFVSHMHSGSPTDAFVAAITACGEAMAAHYPAEPNKPNELSDGLIEI